MIKFDIVQNSPNNTNSVVLDDGENCIIFDAWGKINGWIEYLDKRKLNLLSIYSTHGHPDHINCAPFLSEKFNIPWFLNYSDSDLILWGREVLDYFGLERIKEDYKKPLNIDFDKKEIFDLSMDIIKTPGHTKGSVCFYFKDLKLLIVGDLIFKEGYGRYDLPSGDKNILKESIKKLYEMNFDDNTFVVPGHGEITSIKQLKEENIFFTTQRLI